MSDDTDDEDDNETDEAEGSRRPGKSDSAFRTISEVSDDLEVPQHVLRFWESKFPQIRPLKRGGGRRYYRPEDLALLKRIRDLLYGEGYTIKGVQKLLREGAAKPAPRARPPVEPEPTFLPMAEPEPRPSFAPAPETPPAPASLPPAAAQPLTDTLRAELQGILDELDHLRGLLQPRDG